MSKFKVVITGGHHSPALSVINILTKDPEVEIIWFGHKYSMLGDKNPTMEFHDISVRKIPFYNIHAGKLYRTYNIKRLLKIPFGFLQTFYLLVKIKPDIVMSFGGYIAAPTALSAWFLRIPVITHEQTVVAGYANKFISKFASKILISWETSFKYFPKNKTIFTGLPIRREIFEVRSNNYVFNNDLKTVYITAGKSGSHKINGFVENNLENLLNIANIIHQTGDHSEYDDFTRLNKKYQEIKEKVEGIYIPKKFIFSDEIGEVFSKSDVVISRAGANSIFELINLNIPSIIIPIPWVSHNEQNLNASELVKKIKGLIITEDQLDTSQSLDLVRDFIIRSNKHNINLNKSIRNNADVLIANEILQYKKIN